MIEQISPSRTMTSRERMAAAMHHQVPDRVPVMCQLAVGHYFLYTGLPPHAIWFTSEGFAEALGLAAAIAIPYLLLNAVVLVRGFIEIFSHPTLLSQWQSALWAHPKVSGSLPALLALTALTFPKLALGLSVLPLPGDECCPHRDQAG